MNASVDRRQTPHKGNSKFLAQAVVRSFAKDRDSSSRHLQFEKLYPRIQRKVSLLTRPKKTGLVEALLDVLYRSAFALSAKECILALHRLDEHLDALLWAKMYPKEETY